MVAVLVCGEGEATVASMRSVSGLVVVTVPTVQTPVVGL